MQKIRKILSAVLREKCSRTEPEFVDGQRRTTLGIRTLTSTDVENSTPLTGNILKTEDASDMRFSR